jgi:acetolactate decarboxylase
MKCFKGCWVATFLLLLATVCATVYLQSGRGFAKLGGDDPSTIYQVSTGNALIAGLFEGAVDFKTLAQHGDFGLGSVKGMDGELIAIDGKFYRISPDGSMNIIPPEQTTPYAIVTHFTPQITFTLDDVTSLKDLVGRLNERLPSRNQPYAIHIKGDYSSLKLRAVRGAKPPYPDFMDLVKNQAIFNLQGVKGDSVGFFYPAYLAKVNTPGYHIHFITSDRKTGGHILNVSGDKFEVSLMPVDNLHIAFPDTAAFKENDALNKDNTRLMVDAFGPGIQLD